MTGWMLFVAVTLVAVWAMFPVSLIIATRDFDDELNSDPHQH